jgi:hypothetical protein
MLNECWLFSKLGVSLRQRLKFTKKTKKVNPTNNLRLPDSFFNLPDPKQKEEQFQDEVKKRSGWTRIFVSLFVGSLSAAAFYVSMLFVAFILYYTFWPATAVTFALSLSLLIPLWIFVRNVFVFATNNFTPSLVLKNRAVSTMIYALIFILLFFFWRAIFFWYSGNFFYKDAEKPRLLPKDKSSKLV